MSRRRSASNAMGPPPDRDLVMGPPPPPLPSTQQQPSKDNQDIGEKYRKLKRRYFELEDKHKESQHELKLSGERNVKLREERELILQRIQELENRGESVTPGVPYPPSSAFPRSLLSSRARTAFVTNLRQAMAEDESDDHSVDPLLTSRHVGPLARKRAEEEYRERIEDEAREARRQTKRSRGTAKGKEPVTQSVPGQPLLAMPPTPQHPGESGTPPLLVSKQGTRLRLKPPVRPSAERDPGSSANQRPPSPLSPIMSPPDDHPSHYNPAPYNANGAQAPILAPPPASPPLPGQSPSHTAQTTPAASASRPSEVQRHAKPKRLKAHTVTSKSFSIPTVPRDKKGRPHLPLNVGIMTVVNLGEVCMREHFHTERYIFPVGYEVTRRYQSTIDPHNEVVYHCSILDGGDGPKFQIVASDVPDRPMIAGTATGAWSSIVKQANAIRNRQHSNSVSGPDFFGLSQNTIKRLIQELPNANRLRDYVWQHFVEGG
ncbi:hypothetical protein PAXINDRAFT_72937 [Paxillus involutus ATCC 200175]|nr:hypothetical protein PAXINDRAFT_72937 [Paxillus involutus ATCC 200175]